MSLFEELKKKAEYAASPEGVKETSEFLGLPSGEEITKRTREGRYTLNPLEAMGIVGRPIESVTAAPARAAISSLQGNLDLGEAMKAFAGQFGRNVDLAPSGKQIAEKAGLQGGAAAAAGLGLDVAIDPSNLMGGAALKALPLIGLAGTMAKAGKGAELGQVLAKAGKAAEAADLPMDIASRMARAEKMGFDTSKEWYHGSGKNFSEFKVSSGETGSKKNPGVFLTDDAFIAEEYAGGEVASILEKNEAMLKKKDRNQGGVYVTNLKMGNPKVYDVSGQEWSHLPMEKMIDEAKASGHDAVIFKNIKDGKYSDFTSNVAYVFEPNQIRSINAAFDPSKAKSGIITAGGAGVISLPMLMEKMRRDRENSDRE